MLKTKRMENMEKMWVLYIVQCGDGTYYTGITDDLPRRLAEHNTGKGAKYTRGRGPITLRYYKQMANKSEALKEEYRIKQLPRKEKAELCEKCPMKEGMQFEVFSGHR